jgi:hypothetical protein
MRREEVKKMSPQEYWDLTLTHKGRTKALILLGRALGFQLKQWDELPEDLQRQLVILWSKHVS